MNDLWPTTLTNETIVKPPVSVLREQADLLGSKTNQKIIARVRPFGPSVVGMFEYSFELVAPDLDNYRYQLFNIAYSINFYPLAFEDIEEEIKQEVFNENLSSLKTNDFTFNDLVFKEYLKYRSNGIYVRSEEQFQLVLKKIFNASRTGRIIGTLLAQSKA